uniref:Dynactin subunit 6 n=1 Tax=Strombidium rassoulzadegani TaxID=1082188 RepID=A0A7S3CLC6_9SPIT|mmetsp:Transcript_15740/g.26557  ORF Transcript_15740/g.26557 Transcript_15740/m.26557 type:complete len:112 (+) Transcript_15740:310-645(+)
MDKQGRAILTTMNVGSYNLFEVGSIISSSEIGDYNEFQSKSQVEDNCKIGSNCTVGPKVMIQKGQVLGNNKIMYEDDRYHVNEDAAQIYVKKQKVKDMAGLLIAKLNVVKK